ncbi:MAG: hypothetical protein CFH21_01034 [Alphaproteobacteria bacterium MarineAlpha5_Bin11]|nr:hypothetical protein [Pelagibacteraceae bacterium]PPR42709.1 MAG: hypothetical protein CFH21_01034 [Alphaproteobacteria bacterium MarineAlpha5_Bin11]PPR52106.1 MAG: hypothetical protein CFH20_00011 [Alphaproteobacteria bacterium MarineAlpha5_Bin10]|tara:strand:- start:8681 stop:9574 length:894 start_codon:yes stop_codon:yes gene_type:complete
MRKIGFTGQCPNGDISALTDQINLCKEANVDSLEVSIFETDVIVGKKINLPELKILKDTLLNKGVGYTVHGELSVNLLDQENFEDHKEVLKRDIEVSGEINATHLVTHFGQTTNKIYENKNLYESLLEKQKECYAEMGEYAKKHGVVLAIENLFPFKLDYYAPLPSEISKQLKEIDHPNIKCCLDISHGYINCTFRNAHFLNEINEMAPLSEHIHMHDSFGNIERIWTYIDSEATSYGQGDLHLPLGWGDIPFNKIFEEVKFPENLNLNFELPERYLKYFKENIEKARGLISLQEKI